MAKNRLRDLRAKAQLTQTSIANSLNIGQSTYNRYERGVREPDHETLKRLADFFGVSIDYILCHEAPRNVADINFLDFLKKGRYKINGKFPTVDERERLVKMVTALFC